MRVLFSSVDLQTSHHLATELVLRKHSLDGQFDNSSWMSFLHSSIWNLFEGSRVLTVALIDLLFSLEASNFNLGSVDHDDEVACQHVRHVGGLVLAHQVHCHLRCESSEYLSICVNDFPVVHNFGGLGVVLL